MTQVARIFEEEKREALAQAAKAHEEEKRQAAKAHEEEKRQAAKAHKEEKRRVAKAHEEEKRRVAKAHEEEKRRVAKAHEEEKQQEKRQIVIRMIQKNYPTEEISFMVPDLSLDMIEAIRKEELQKKNFN